MSMDRLARPVATKLHDDHMRRLGIRNTMKIALAYNRMKYGTFDEYRKTLYRDRFNDLIEENGPPLAPIVQMNDGWALDTSGRLPHLDQLLSEAEEVIKQRGQVQLKDKSAYRSYFQNIAVPADAETYPSFLNFGLSSEILATVSNYLKNIPVLSGTLPPGIRLAESYAKYAEGSAPNGAYKDSQLFHIDYYALPMVYVIVLLRDVTPQSGPFYWMSLSKSAQAARALNYWSRGTPYRITDERFYSVADNKDVHPLIYPKGTVLFVESTGCFHYGSRDAIVPRYQMMYGYSGACRTDLSELVMTPLRYPVRDGDSLLRKMVLRRECMG